MTATAPLGTPMPDESQPALLAAENITVRFGGVVALDQVSLSVPRGSTVGLVGPNGAGKTTLFGVLSGLLRPRSGRVLMNGDDITRRSPQARAQRGLARTFQRMELFTELTVREHLVVARRVHEGRQRFTSFFLDLSGFGERPGPGEDEAVDAILSLLGLEAVADRPAVSVPLGTGRLVEVARALASEPSVMLLDEPSSGLDVHETEQLGDALRRVRQERGTAFVLVEHNVEFVLDLSDRVTVLDFGRLLTEGLPEEVRDSPEVQAAYFGAPLDASVDASVDAPADAPSRGQRMTADATTTPLLRVTDLEVAYGEARALFGVAFDVRAGSVTTVLGANGAGKSSLASAIAGVVKPTAGQHRVRRCGDHGLVGAPRQQDRPRVRARVAQHLPAPLRARQPLGADPVHGPTAARAATRWTMRSRCSRFSPSAVASRRARCRVASSRCSASPACWPRRRSCSSPTRCRSASRR